MVVFCVLCHHQTQIQVLSIIDFEAFGYAFMDKNFVNKHLFPLHKLKYLYSLL